MRHKIIRSIRSKGKITKFCNFYQFSFVCTNRRLERNDISAIHQDGRGISKSRMEVRC